MRYSLIFLFLLCSQVPYAQEQLFERRLLQANIIFACLGFGLGVIFLWHGVRLGLLDSILGSIFLFAFFPMNIILSIRSYGIICQIILLLSTLLFPILTAYDFINATYINPDPQSALVLLLGPAYSILMIPFWLVALYLSSQRTIPILKLWYSSSGEPLDDQWLRAENETTEAKTSAKSDGGND